MDMAIDFACCRGSLPRTEGVLNLTPAEALEFIAHGALLVDLREAARMLGPAGYTNIAKLSDGMIDWDAANLPVRACACKIKTRPGGIPSSISIRARMVHACIVSTQHSSKHLRCSSNAKSMRRARSWPKQPATAQPNISFALSWITVPRSFPGGHQPTRAGDPPRVHLAECFASQVLDA
jgi:hypothetical protein